MARLTKKQITSGFKKSVEIEELGGHVEIRLLTLRESLEFGEQSKTLDSNDAMMLYASYLIADEDGSRMFTPEEVADLPARVLMEIVEHGNKINGVDDEVIEDTAKNS